MMSALLDLVNTTENTFKLYSSWKWHLLGPLKSEYLIGRALCRYFISWWWVHTDFHFSHSVSWWMQKPSLVLDPVSKSPEASLEKVCIHFLILQNVLYCFMHFPVVSFRAPLLCSTFNVLNSSGIRWGLALEKYLYFKSS